MSSTSLQGREKRDAAFKATYASVLVNAVLMVMQIAIGFFAGSDGLLACIGEVLVMAILSVVHRIVNHFSYHSKQSLTPVIHAKTPRRRSGRARTPNSENRINSSRI